MLLTITHTDVLESRLTELRRLQHAHAFWTNPLLVGFETGAFTRDDLRYIYSQYYLYSKSFTRFVAAVMANCESDLFRAQLSENLWDEGGGCDPERRHAQLFRNFLRRALGIDPETIAHAAYTQHFVREYLVQCLRSEPMAGTAFLSLGTEGIVSRMYEIMVRGMRRAGIADEDLEFFHLHIGCDDEHAVTLERMMASYHDEPGWFETCRDAMNRALELRGEFFTAIFESLRTRRIAPMLARMNARASLAAGMSDAAICHRTEEQGETLYANTNERLNIEFTVERLPLGAQVLDPRIVRIPPGRNNENHKHAHETLIHILAGTGKVVVDDRNFAVAAGDSVLVPRWAMHQTHNTGACELRFLAVTDFNLSQHAYVGDATDYRLTVDADGRRRH